MDFMARNEIGPIMWFYTIDRDFLRVDTQTERLQKTFLLETYGLSHLYHTLSATKCLGAGYDPQAR